MGDTYWFWTSEMAELEKHYNFIEEADSINGDGFELREYIANHRSLIPLLLEIPLKIKEYFENKGKPILELSIDPESGHKDLVIAGFIDWDNTTVNKVFKQEKNFNKWWLDKWVNLPSRITVSLI